MIKHQFAISCKTEDEVKSVLRDLIVPEDTMPNDPDIYSLDGFISWPRFSCSSISGASRVEGTILYSNGYSVVLTIERGVFQWFLFSLQAIAFLGASYVIFNGSYSIPVRGLATIFVGVIAYPLTQFLLQTDAQKTIKLFKERFKPGTDAATFA